LAGNKLISSMNSVGESSENSSSPRGCLHGNPKPKDIFLIIIHIYICCRKYVTTEGDDNVSVAGSSVSVKVRRNEAERVQILLEST